MHAEDFKNGFLKQWIYTCQSWTAGRRDSTLFGVVVDTTTTKFTSRTCLTCAVHCSSLSVVVVVLKFPNVCTTASFIAQISSFKSVSNRDTILALVAKQRIAKKRAKIAIHWFGEY